ncbi:MAG: alanine racemase [Micavibrio sp. TMED27]|nr:alanine racemase [Micavibrio sp.]OUT92460.1 MAG: alanine racemase [Micavibrio sp. TMED27]|tara:strand:- start:247 stop:1341 length:1095 start_codon:yes stop_codon:yes gene_type:complete
MKDYVGHLRIDLNALKQNYIFLQNTVKNNTEVSAAVKANGYGLGSVIVARTLFEAGCRKFFVANLDEAITLREQLKEPEIYILNGFYNAYADQYTAHNLIPVIDSLPELKQYKDFTHVKERSLPCVLHFNTTMNRLGFSESERTILFQTPSLIEGLDIKMVMSHLACADEKDHEMNKIQLSVFKEISQYFKKIPSSLANSSGIFINDEFHFDIVRPGSSLYGINPMPYKHNPMKKVVNLCLPVIKTRTVDKGAHIGYGATYRFKNKTPIACVASGYADGLLRSLSNKGGFYWKGIRCPIRGRVSMDLISVDLSAVPEQDRPGQGDFLEVLGEHQDVDALADDAGTIGYEILTSLGTRYEREYVS